MSDCHDMTREERAELVADGRELLAENRFLIERGGNWAGLWHLLDRALDAIEWLDRQPRLEGQPGHRIELDEPPTMKVGLGPLGLDVRIE